jgi:hypothetical protein
MGQRQFTFMRRQSLSLARLELAHRPLETKERVEWKWERKFRKRILPTLGRWFRVGIIPEVEELARDGVGQDLVNSAYPK